MCKLTITNISNNIATILSDLILLDLSELSQHNGINVGGKSRKYVSQQVATVSMYLVELLNLQKKDDNDKKSIKSILEISIPQLQRIINQLGDLFDPLSEIDVISTSLTSAVNELDILEWRELKISLIILFASIYR